MPAILYKKSARLTPEIDLKMKNTGMRFPYPTVAISYNVSDNGQMSIFADPMLCARRMCLPAAVLIRSITLAVILFTSITYGAPVSAQGVEFVNARMVADRPNIDDGSTEITVSIFIIDIDEINDVRQRFNVDMFVNIAWQDPSLALAVAEQSDQIRTLPRSSIWTPRGLIVNDRGLKPQLPLVVDIDAVGNVVYRQRFAGELAVDLNLNDFPFDTQHLPIDVISYHYSPDEVRFSQKSSLITKAESFSVAGWNFGLPEILFGKFEIPAADVVRPRITFIVEAQREAQYYLMTMFLPMSLIVFMSWTAFWIQPNLIPPRIAISTASIFSLIAFGFSIRLSLPRVSYLTRADIFVIGCTLLVFLALGAAVIGSRWANSDKLDQAIRLNATTRWVYVVLFVMVAVATAII